MLLLILVSLLWAFSFGLIKRHLAGIDPLLVALLRLAVAAVAFLPWLHPRAVAGALRRRCLLWGGVQFGLMYVLYLAAYRDLTAGGIAVLTVLTPLYIALLDDARSWRLRPRRLAAALLAVAGAAVVVWRGEAGTLPWRGALLVQGSNLCFAAGQLAFRELAGRPGGGRAAADAPPEAAITAWMYLGALLLTGTAAVVTAPWADPARLAPLGAPTVLLVIAGLGLLQTALGFHLWNKGAARVAAGPLAVANNLKVPLGVLAAWLVFGEQGDRLRTAAGLAIILLALAVAREGASAGGGSRRAPVAG